MFWQETLELEEQEDSCCSKDSKGLHLVVSRVEVEVTLEGDLREVVEAILGDLGWEAGLTILEGGCREEAGTRGTLEAIIEEILEEVEIIGEILGEIGEATGIGAEETECNLEVTFFPK